MPWSASDFRDKHWKDATDAQAAKAAGIANEMLKNGAEESVAIATAIKNAKAEEKKVEAGGATGDAIISEAWGGEVTFSAVATMPDGAEKKPRGFSLAAYNGGPMRLGGFKFPVVIEAAGVRSASEDLPIYVGHPAPDAPASELMEVLVGQAPCVTENGRITAAGTVTGSSKTIGLMLEHERRGFKFQASIHGRPIEPLGFIRAGQTEIVNGRLIAGPATVARQSVLDHIAILPLGADTSTSARIAAQNAAGETHMEFTAWLQAEYGMDEEAFKKLPDARQTKVKAEFDTGGKADDKAKADDKKIEASGAVTDAGDLIKAQNDAVSANLTRITKINEAAKDFPAIAAEAIRDGWTVEKADNAVLRAQRDALTQGTFGTPNIGRGGHSLAAEGGSRVLEAAVLLSCGYNGEQLVKDRAYGEKAVNETDKLFRAEGSAMTPSHIAAICAKHLGIGNLPHGHGDDFWQEVLSNERICPRGGQRISAAFSTLSLPVALSNVMNKFVLAGYDSVDPNECDPAGGVAWRQFCRVSSVQDFKTHFRLRLVPSILLKKLLQGGEIQHGTIGEQSYTLTADTKAIMLGLTRKDLINDDQSVLSSLPSQFGLAAGETVANDIYSCFLTGYQSDGSTAFWTTSAVTAAGNLMKANSRTSSGLSFSTLESGRASFGLQTKPTGGPAGLLPRILLVPPQLAGLARQLCESDMLIASLSTGGNARGVPANNTLKGMQKPVSSGYLANGANPSDGSTALTGSASDWFLTTDPVKAAYVIDVGFLNGQQNPTIERAEADFNRLGISFRAFLDYGVAMGEPRAGQKNAA